MSAPGRTAHSPGHCTHSMDHGHKEWMWTSPGLRPHSGYPPSEERGVAHRGDTGEMGVGRDGRVIDLRVPNFNSHLNG